MKSLRLFLAALMVAAIAIMIVAIVRNEYLYRHPAAGTGAESGPPAGVASTRARGKNSTGSSSTTNTVAEQTRVQEDLAKQMHREALRTRFYASDLARMEALDPLIDLAARLPLDVLKAEAERALEMPDDADRRVALDVFIAAWARTEAQAALAFADGAIGRGIDLDYTLGHVYQTVLTQDRQGALAWLEEPAHNDWEGERKRRLFNSVIAAEIQDGSHYEDLPRLQAMQRGSSISIADALVSTAANDSGEISKMIPYLGTLNGNRSQWFGAELGMAVNMGTISESDAALMLQPLAGREDAGVIQAAYEKGRTTGGFQGKSEEDTYP